MDITTPAIEQYATEHTSAEPQHLVELAAATRSFSTDPGMMIGRLEGRFLKMLVAITGARRILEIGTFTGYSALSMAEALPPDGSIVTCELSERHAGMARQMFDVSPYGAKIEIKLGPALDTLRQLHGPFDFVFIDADKAGYADYYEAVVPMLAPSGVIAADNVLWSGRMLDGTVPDASTTAIMAFNDRVANDPRVECVMVPIRDGVTLIRRVS